MMKKLGIDGKAYLDSKLSPISRELDSLGAKNMIIGLIPHIGAMHIACNEVGLQNQVNALREVAKLLNQQADNMLAQGGRIVPAQSLSGLPPLNGSH